RMAHGRDLATQDAALAGSAAIEGANDPVGEVVDVHEIQSETFEGPIAQPPLRERVEIRTDRGVVIRSVDLTGLRDHDRRSATPRLERDVVSAPFGVLVRGCRWRCGPVTLRHDNAMRVAEGGDRGD